MKKLKLVAFCLSLLALAACSKHSDNAVVSVPLVQIGTPISNTAPLAAGTYKGTMLANQTYIVNGDITVKAGDTLLIQKGVTVKVNNGAAFIVNGTLISLGTSDAPITITDPSKTKTTGASLPGTDPAYTGGWGGIFCSPTCPLLVIKWTHLDFAGYPITAANVFTSSGLKVGDQRVLYYNNPNGLLILEDSWIYGSPDDATRFYGGAMNIMRNTMEKCGGVGGDGFNAKGSAYGNMAYNLIIGGATNGTKTANDLTTGPSCQFAMYNNTYVNDGFRNTGAYGARSGSIEVENSSKVLAYNNLMVNCYFGLRIAGGPSGKVFCADTTTTAVSATNFFPRTAYGYNYYYADSLHLAQQFVPTNIAQPEATIPQATDIPNMQSLIYTQLQANPTYSASFANIQKSPGQFYPFGYIYNAAPVLAAVANPLFVNFPLPATVPPSQQASVDGYNFRLSPNSPAVGKGTNTAFVPITAGIKIDPTFGASEITLPGKDMGCYQTNGNGNHH